MAEFNLGLLGLNVTRQRTNLVGASDPIDTFQFAIAEAATYLNVSLTGMTQNANVSLFRDVNNNGVIDAGDGAAIATASRGGPVNDAINVRLTAAGSYLVQVNRVGASTTNYTLRVSNTSEASNLLPVEINAGVLRNIPFSRTDSLGLRDTADVYGFRMGRVGNFNASLTRISATSEIDMRLIRDANGNGRLDAGDVLVSSTAGLNTDDSINVRSLAVGNYFLQTYRVNGGTGNYTLRLSNTGNSGEAPSNLLATEINVGALSVDPYINVNRLQRRDASDTFRFTMATVGNFNATLTGIDADHDIDMRLIRDANGNGIVDASDVLVRATRSLNSDDSIMVRSLAAGSYILQTYLYSGSNSRYTLRLSNTGNRGQDASNLLLTDVNAGTLTATPFDRDEVVSPTDASDVFRFVMGTEGNFNASLTGISLGSDVDMRLIQDANGNGIVDAGDVVVSSALAGNNDEAIHVRSLAAGTYFLQTHFFSGSTDGRYALRMSNTGDAPSNLLPAETDVGDLLAPFNVADSLGNNDAADTFRFGVTSSRSVTVTVTGLTANADLRLIQDINTNGIVDAGDVLQASITAGNLNETITRTLGAGSYLAQVYLAAPGTATAYSLGIT